MSSDDFVEHLLDNTEHDLAMARSRSAFYVESAQRFERYRQEAEAFLAGGANDGVAR